MELDDTVLQAISRATRPRKSGAADALKPRSSNQNENRSAHFDGFAPKPLSQGKDGARSRKITVIRAPVRSLWP